MPRAAAVAQSADGVYPRQGDPDFQNKIARMLNFRMHEIAPFEEVKDVSDFDRIMKDICAFDKALYQHIFEQYLARTSIYKGVLIFHGLGVGKTCTAITVAESVLSLQNYRAQDRTVSELDRPVWVIASPALLENFKKAIFDATKLLAPGAAGVDSQCTRDLYLKLSMSMPAITHASMTADQLKTMTLKRIHNIIQSRYTFFTYDEIAKFVKTAQTAGTLSQIVQNKVIIIDEAHNLRNAEDSTKLGESILHMVEAGQGNKLLLLTATPMYNEPDEILRLMHLLLANDKRTGVLLKKATLYNKDQTQNEPTWQILRQLSQEYVSYIKSQNPFTFAARLTPVVNGYQTLQSFTWLSSIKDGLLPTPLGIHQLQALSNISAKQKAKNNRTQGRERERERALVSMDMLQTNNIVFPQPTGARKRYETGNSGFNSIMQITNENIFQMRYINKQQPWFYPNDEYLGSIAAKLKRVVDIIRNAEGIVLVYSQFILGGVVPLAAALEHIGFRRYDDVPILSERVDVKDNPVPPVTKPSRPAYAIICGTQSYSGKHSLSELMDVITHPRNSEGSVVKVVLMTKVASEGLSFKNVREIHILDPWYHLNRIEQVIGRGIRTCSHSDLPISKRNVSVYLHAAVYPDDPTRETDDLHAYMIAARKQGQIASVEALLRDHALDCPIQKNANYVPQRLFKFTINMTTSHGASIPYRFGDAPDAEPRCEMPTEVVTTAWRKEAYQHVLPTVQQRLTKFFRSALVNGVTTFELSDIEAKIKIQSDVLKEALASMLQTVIHDDHILKIHRNKFVLVKRPYAQKGMRVEVAPMPRPPRQAAQPSLRAASAASATSPARSPGAPCDLERMNLHADLFRILALDAACYLYLVQSIILKKHWTTEPKFVAIADLLIANHLLTKEKNAYLDMFDPNGLKLKTWYGGERQEFADSPANEAFLMPFRNAHPRDETYGIYAPYVHKGTDAAANPGDVILTFKIVNPGQVAQGRAQGIVCNTVLIRTIKEHLKAMRYRYDEPAKPSRPFYCDSLRQALLENRKLWLVSSAYSHSKPYADDGTPLFVPLEQP